MPGGYMALEQGFPTLEGQSTERQIQLLQDYIRSLLQQLRYILYNLSKDNFNSADYASMADEIRAGVVISNTVITNEIYSEYGSIADLVVNELRTDYDMAARYLAGNTGDIDYVHAHDEEVSLITGAVVMEDDEPQTEQLHHGSRYFWWKDSGMTQMTSTEATAWPVMVYQYSRLTKATMRFSEVDGIKVPEIILGAGYGAGTRGKAYVRKVNTGLDIWLQGQGDARTGLSITSSGVTALGTWSFPDDIELPQNSQYPTRTEVQAMIDAALGPQGGGNGE